MQRVGKKPEGVLERLISGRRDETDSREGWFLEPWYKKYEMGCMIGPD